MVQKSLEARVDALEDALEQLRNLRRDPVVQEAVAAPVDEDRLADTIAETVLAELERLGVLVAYTQVCSPHPRD